MIRFHTLGTVRLRSGDGSDIQAVLTQPMQIALLAYLAVARPRGFHRRDILFGLFWPEVDMAHARGALNQAVYRLRQALGREAVRGRAKDELGIDPAHLWCDVAAFEQASAAGAHRKALELYGGDLLAGLFLSGTPTWERWLEGERARLRTMAAGAAWTLADEAAADGRIEDTGHLGRRALAMDPGNEASLRRLIRLLDGVGDRAGAIRAYEETAATFAAEYEVSPSPETEALIASVRERSEPRRAAVAVEAHRPVDRAPSAAPIDEVESEQLAAARDTVAHRRRRGRAGTIAGGAIVILASLLWLGTRSDGPDDVGAEPSAVPVLAAGIECGPELAVAEPAAEAVREYERGRYHLSQVGPRAAERARDRFQRALDLEPTYAAAWSGLASAFENLGALRLLPPEGTYPRARAAAERAICLDDGIAEAHAVLGWLLAVYYWDTPGADREFRRAVALDPVDARTRRLLAAHLRNLGRFDQALGEIHQAQRLDPLHGFSRIEEGMIHYMSGDYEVALERFEQFLQVAPELRHTHMFVALAEAARGRYDAAMHALDRADPDAAGAVAVALRGYLFARSGRTEEARGLLEILHEKTARNEANPMQLALVHVGLGEHDAALELLERGLATRAPEMRLLNVEPLFDPLRGDPRFRDLLKRAGFGEADILPRQAPDDGRRRDEMAPVRSGG